MIQKQIDTNQTASPARTAKELPPRSVLLRMLYGLKLTRQLEHRIEHKLYRQGKIYGGVFTGRGQEALSVGSILAFEHEDVICPSHRDAGVYLLRGMTVERLLANYMGRTLGPSRGRDGNIHTGDMDLNLVAFISHLADNIPVGTGLAWSFALRNLPRVAVVYFGDGASSRGDFHEGLNLAAVHRLPVVFFCNNNQYAYSTPLKRQMAVPGVAERAIGYGFPTLTVDGTNVLEVYRVAREAADRARSGGGPTLIEGISFRMSGHSGHDDAHYVPRHLIETWRAKDPIVRFTRTLLEHGVVTEQGVSELERQIEAEIDRALAIAGASPEPHPESALEDVYSDLPHHAPRPHWRLGPQERPDCSTLTRAPVEVVETVGGRSAGADRGERGSTYVEAIRRGLEEEMASDPDVFLLGEDIGEYGGAFRVTEGLFARFGDRRVIDTPIAESGIVGAAIGAALGGMRPVVEMQFIDFISCAFDQITNFAAKCRYRWGASVPLVIRGPCGGGVNGGPFHSQNVESYFVHTPGLKIVAPATPADARGLLKSAIRDNDPVLYFEHKYLYRHIREVLPEGDGAVPLGKAACRRPGRDLSIITFGAMVYRALEVAERLARDGVEVEVLDLRSLLPLDLEAVLESVSRTSKAIVLHEAPLTGGLGGEIAALIGERAFEYLDGPVRRVASPDTPVPYSKPLETYFLPQTEEVVRVARELLDY